MPVLVTSHLPLLLLLLLLLLQLAGCWGPVTAPIPLNSMAW
jgi:hypothetical protein